MELGDYRTWRAVLPDRSHLLLDSETELPAAETLESEDGPLERVAAAIHANGSKLAPEDCEHDILGEGIASTRGHTISNTLSWRTKPSRLRKPLAEAFRRGRRASCTSQTARATRRHAQLLLPRRSLTNLNSISGQYALRAWCQRRLGWP
jgi:hypothetical protein